MAILFYAAPSFAVWNDTFAGTDGAAPDYDKWNYIQSWNRNDPFILNDALYFDGDTNDSWLGSSYHLQGNFDIQVDWSMEALPTDRNWRIAFGIGAEDLTGDEDWDGFYVMRERNTSYFPSCTDNMTYNLYINRDASITRFPVCNNTHTSGKLRLVREDAPTLDKADFNDDFTGTNGDAPDNTKWRETLSSYQDPEIQSNKLYCFVNDHPGSSWVGSIYNMQGDFDIQVDWSDASHATSGDYRYTIEAWIDSSDYFQIYRGRKDGNGCAWGKAYYTRHNTNGGGETFSDPYCSEDLSGKLRLVRTSDMFYGYMYDSGWQLVGSGTCTTNDMQIWVGTNGVGTGGGQFYVSFDNYQINSGTLVYPTNSVASAYYYDSGWQLIDTYPCTNSDGRVWLGGAGWGTGTQPDISFTNFKINSVDSVLENQVHFSGTQPTKFGTAFNGDNNSAPDPSVWTMTSGSGGEGYIYNDKLRMTVPGPGSIYAYYNPIFEGDFDVVMDWEESGANDNYWVGGVLGFVDDPDIGYITISRLYTSSADRYRSDTHIGGSHNVGTNITTSDTSGRFRIARYGDKVRVYYWNNSSNNWDQTPDQNSLTTTSGIQVVPRLVSGSSNPSHTFDWDNFHVVADQSTPTGWVDTYTQGDMRYVDHNNLVSSPIANTSGWLYHPYWLTGDIDVRVSMRNAWSASSTDQETGWILQLWDDNPGNEYLEIGRWRRGGNAVIRTRYDIGAGVVDNQIIASSSIRLRLNRTGSTWTMYYYDFTNRTWINMTQVTGGTQDLTLWLGTYSSPISSQTAAMFYYYALDGTNGSSYTYS